MQKVLQNLWQLSDQEFQPIWEEIKDNLDGDLPQIWVDRPWHPLTRKEIYSLILVTNHLGYALPRLILERIAFWIQLIDLCQDLHSGKLWLQIVMPVPKWTLGMGFWKNKYRRLSSFLNGYKSDSPLIFKGKIVVSIVSYEDSDSWRLDKEWLQDEFRYLKKGWITEEEKDHFLSRDNCLRMLLERKDRYRIQFAERQEWENL